MRLSYFSDASKKWDPSLVERACALLEKTYTEYQEEDSDNEAHANVSPSDSKASEKRKKASQAPKEANSSFLDNALSTSQPPAAKATEIERYLSHTYPTDDTDGALKWWAVSSTVLFKL